MTTCLGVEGVSISSLIVSSCVVKSVVFSVFNDALRISGSFPSSPAMKK